MLIIAVVAIAGAVATGMRMVVKPLVRRPRDEATSDFISRLWAATAAAAPDIATLAAFAASGRLALDGLLPQADLARSIAQSALDALALFGLYIIAGRFLLAPQAPQRRLLPLPHAQWHWRMLLAYGLIQPILMQSVRLSQEVGGERVSLEGWFLIASTIVLALRLSWFWGGRHDIAALARGDVSSASKPGLLRRLAGSALPWIFIAVAVFIWSVNRIGAVSPTVTRLGAPGTLTQLLVVILPILTAGAGAIVSTLTSRALVRSGSSPARLALAAVASNLTTGVMWLTSFGVLALVWSDYLSDIQSTAAVAALQAVLAAGTAFVTGWIIWTYLSTYFAAHAPKARSGIPIDEDGSEAPVRTRLATVLPLLKGVGLGGVVAVTALVMLASLGVQIGPFLAGFGVIGLAISFGSQALVKDVVSGVFFLTDDAFRIGEYIDIGNLKGTVEKITLRSVQLRHQNGQVHTIPFGQIQSTTNFSRDWATMKFSLRLDHSANIEQARKLIKKIGQEMLEDPELGSEFLLPLKMQGVQEIQDGAIVIRCKFTAKPNNPTHLQRQALKRIYARLNEAGVPFASNTVIVRGNEGSGMSGGAAVASGQPAPTVTA
ncbi:hypothetical protein AXW83_15985 [Bosea sp. PAMC 26642]|nr:hypothetical protein AXW83_15985 [Bosea sp. PAMC 26642]